MPQSIWVAELYISDRTADKIIELHHITVDEVRDAVLCVKGLLGSWNDDPVRGRRALVPTYIRGDRALVVLYPASETDSDRWNLGSVYFTNKV